MSLLAVEIGRHVEQLVAEHDARSVKAVIVGAAACPSHDATQVGSVGRHESTQVAIVVHAASFGQLVGFRQQLAAMQAMQVALEVPPKMSVAPGQAAASPVAPIEPSSDVEPSLIGETPPPPVTPAVQGTPSFDVQPPRIGGCDSLLEEQAKTAPRSPASAGPRTRASERGRPGRPWSRVDRRAAGRGEGEPAEVPV
jgi:hypothetical protein